MSGLATTRPLLCLVTDRRRLDSAAGADFKAVSSRLVDQVRAAAHAGVALVQIREREMADAELARLVSACLLAVDGTPCRVVVNDRFDVALAAGAHGVHLRADSYAAERIRDLGPPPFLVGRSVHDAGKALEAVQGRAVDYLVFGPLFPTVSKPGRAAAGIEALRQTVRAAAPVPVLAIGGITEETGAGLGRSGAAGLAGIGLFIVPGDEAMAARVRRLQQTFDSSPVLLENTRH